MGAAARHSFQPGLGLAVLCLAAAVNLLQSAALSPLLPSIGATFGTSDATTGQLATLGSLVGFVFSLGATPLMDRWSRRTWFRLEATLIAGGLLLSALAPAFIWMALGRILCASGASLIMANCMTGAREMFPDTARRNRAIGLIVSASTLVFVVGLPAVTQIDARFGWRQALASLLIPTVLLLFGTLALPTTREGAPSSAPPARPFAAFRAVLADRRVGALLVVLGLLSALYSGWFVYFGAYTTTDFAISASVLGLLFLIGGLSQLVVNNLAPLLLRRFDPPRVLYAALTGVAVALLSTGIAVISVPTALLAAIVVLNGCGTAYIAANVLLLDSDLSHPGAVMSLAAASGSLGAALGPLITGLALASTESFAAAYRVLGLLAPLCIAIAWAAMRRRAPAVVIEQAS